MTSYWVNAAIKAALDQILDRADVTSAGKVRIYSGTAPADADAALSGNTLLAELSLSATGFANSVDSSPGATATANAISNDASADNTGTATFFRILDGANAVVCQGTVGTSGQELNLNTVSIVQAAIVSISAATVFMAESA